ncbi:hypothetical protein TNCV_1687871 [Trichonephila clavipes]|nr:hypothetical protein TNCV_1687871 [Trichonephila clavipes]
MVVLALGYRNKRNILDSSYCGRTLKILIGDSGVATSGLGGGVARDPHARVGGGSDSDHQGKLLHCWTIAKDGSQIVM